jgi:hypothetical protein
MGRESQLIKANAEVNATTDWIEWRQVVHR